MENHQKLLALYNEVDELLRGYYKNDNYSNSVIMKFIKDLQKSGSFKYEEYGRKLNMIRVIRNDLIHDLDMNSQKLITINDETIVFLEELVSVLKNPVSAYDICTKFKDVSYIPVEAKDTLIIDLVKRMRQRGFSQMPVLEKNNVVYGVFSANVLFDYIKDTDGNIEDTKLSDIMDFLPVEKHFSESYNFVPANMNLRKISEILTEEYEANKKPVMIFVTQHGNAKEPLMGIIVASDLIKAF